MSVVIEIVFQKKEYLHKFLKEAYGKQECGAWKGETSIKQV